MKGRKDFGPKYSVLFVFSLWLLNDEKHSPFSHTITEAISVGVSDLWEMSFLEVWWCTNSEAEMRTTSIISPAGMWSMSTPAPAPVYKAISQYRLHSTTYSPLKSGYMKWVIKQKCEGFVSGSKANLGGWEQLVSENSILIVGLFSNKALSHLPLCLFPYLHLFLLSHLLPLNLSLHWIKFNLLTITYMPSIY